MLQELHLEGAPSLVGPSLSCYYYTNGQTL
jgi:hypothetical protein